MSWLKMLKPTRWKVVISLMPFSFPLVQVWVDFQIKFDLYLDVDNILYDVEEVVIFTVLLTEKLIAAPFELVLSKFGWWSNNGLFALPNGPLLPGSFAVAIIYAILIYLIWSLVSLRKGKRR